MSPGEAVGLIGSNGSGKSTLLKILTKAMYPYAGTVETRGRIGALIEIAGGLHPQLDGRENVFFYGSLLGMQRKQIAGKLDEIIESVNDIKRASPGPYFFTRLQQRLQSNRAGILERIGSWISRPVIAFGSLLIIIILNIAVLTNKSFKSDRFEDNGDEYTIASTTIFDYSNPETE